MSWDGWLAVAMVSPVGQSGVHDCSDVSVRVAGGSIRDEGTDKRTLRGAGVAW